MDFILSLLAILILSPVLLVLSLLVTLKLGSPILFRQERPGLNGKIFTMYKFRSMTDERDEAGKLLPDKERLTKFGRMLRATSLDELPGLFNILKGDMSIVGPRPLLVKYLPLYNARQERRHDTRPGLTGAAQVSGRNRVDWEERFELDVLYTENITFWNDVKIIFRTVKTVLNKEGINPEETTEETMQDFEGTPEESYESGKY